MGYTRAKHHGTVADPKILKGGKTIYQLRPHAQMRTTKYVPFTWRKRLFDKIYELIGGAAPTDPFESATATGYRQGCRGRANSHVMNPQISCITV